jgi:hypothetical protein
MWRTCRVRCRDTCGETCHKTCGETSPERLAQAVREVRDVPGELLSEAAPRDRVEVLQAALQVVGVLRRVVLPVRRDEDDAVLRVELPAEYLDHLVERPGELVRRKAEVLDRPARREVEAADPVGVGAGEQVKSYPPSGGI